MFVILLVLLFISALFEATVISIPLSFVLLLSISIAKRTSIIFALAFAAGIFLDIFNLRILGSSSIFLLLFFLMVLLYQRKYEIHSYPFIIVSSFAGAYVYLLVFGHGGVFLQAGVSCIIAVSLFAIMKTTKFSI